MCVRYDAVDIDGNNIDFLAGNFAEVKGRRYQDDIVSFGEQWGRAYHLDFKNMELNHKSLIKNINAIPEEYLKPGINCRRIKIDNDGNLH